MAKLGDLPREIIIMICDLLWSRDAPIAKAMDLKKTSGAREVRGILIEGRQDVLNLLLAMRTRAEIDWGFDNRCWSMHVAAHYYANQTICIDTASMSLAGLVEVMRHFASRPQKCSSVRRLLLNVGCDAPPRSIKEIETPSDDDIALVREQAPRVGSVFDAGLWMDPDPLPTTGDPDNDRIIDEISAKMHHNARCLSVIRIIIHLMSNVEQVGVIDKVPGKLPDTVGRSREATALFPNLKQVVVHHGTSSLDSCTGIMSWLGLHAPEIHFGQRVLWGGHIAMTNFDPVIFENVTHLTLGWVTVRPDMMKRIIQSCQRLVSFNYFLKGHHLSCVAVHSVAPANVLSCLVSSHGESLRSLGLDFSTIRLILAQANISGHVLSIFNTFSRPGNQSLVALSRFTGLEQLCIDDYTLKAAARADKEAASALQVDVPEVQEPDVVEDQPKRVFPWIPPTVKRVCIRGVRHLKMEDVAGFAEQHDVEEIRLVEESSEAGGERDDFADVLEGIVATGTRASVGELSDMALWGSQLRATGDTPR
ncbi:hypothetical protein CPLU01_06196 [Colletotrichum plurivorum]|uniref:Uncharacterized protein n=1 Tax=Colletotrichum plurivorum TaxID=2175906 RepID=A0A8H6KJS8_9PEZI|nr:hypothetical protein CPLU01_06196 [Colletotrichum plurivorum]